MVTIRYNGWTYTGRIKSAKLVGREMFVTVTWNKGRVEKCLHHTHVRIQKAHVHQTAIEAA